MNAEYWHARAEELQLHLDEARALLVRLVGVLPVEYLPQLKLSVVETAREEINSNNPLSEDTKHGALAGILPVQGKVGQLKIGLPMTTSRNNENDSPIPGLASEIFEKTQTLQHINNKPVQNIHRPEASSARAGSAVCIDATSSLVNIPFGINVAGYFASEKGVGEAARASIRALRAAGIPYVLNNFTDASSVNPDTDYSAFDDNNPYSVNLIHVNADQSAAFAEQKGSQYFEERYNIGYWFWELSEFPAEWQSSFRYFDEIWVASNFVLDAISRVAPIPVTKIPLSLPTTLTVRNDLTRAYFNIPDGKFIFTFIYDFHSNITRKNPLGLIEAFKRAFTMGDNALLILKCAHSERHLAELEILQQAAQGINFHIIDKVLSRDELNTLLAQTDCYISLHRSEGFGLTLAEAMLLGKPVIATGYSSNTDFMTMSNSFLVKYQLTEIDRDYGPYKKGCVWAEPDLEHAAELMRYVYQNPESALKIGSQARRDIAELHPQRVGGIIKERLLSIHSIINNYRGEA